MSDSRLDIFEVLKNIDNKNYSYYENLSEDEQKKFNTFMVLKWSAGTSSYNHYHHVNDICNRYVLNFYNHPNLCYKLFAAISDGNKKKYTWNKSYKSEKFKYKLKALTEFLDCSEKKAVPYLNYYTNDQFIEMAEQLGWDKKEISKLKKEFNEK